MVKVKTKISKGDFWSFSPMLIKRFSAFYDKLLKHVCSLIPKYVVDIYVPVKHAF